MIDDKQLYAGLRSPRALLLVQDLLQRMRNGSLVAAMRLPAERELCEQFNISRGTVRRILSNFSEQGLLHQMPGSGTFVTDKATLLLQGAGSPQIASTADPAYVSPADLMAARLLIEPLMPQLIVQNGTVQDFERMQECLTYSEQASSIEEFEHWDEQLHAALATATHNAFFTQLLGLVNQVRDQGEWGNLKKKSLTLQNRRAYERQHRELVEALRARDAGAAKKVLTQHLEQIQVNLFQIS